MRTLCFLWRSQTSTHLSLSAARLTMRAIERRNWAIEGAEGMWNLHRICRAASPVVTAASGQNNQLLDPYGAASCHGAELTPSDQTTTPLNWAFASLVAWKKSAADLLHSGRPLTVYPLWIAFYLLQGRLIYNREFSRWLLRQAVGCYGKVSFGVVFAACGTHTKGPLA